VQATEVVSLSPAEAQIATFIGKTRNKMSLATKNNQRRDPAQDDEQMNIEAAGAELAVAKYLNVYPDLSPTRQDLPKYDLRWRGRRVEVKRNHEPNGDLLVPRLYHSLIYILACGHLPEYNLIGYIEGIDIPDAGEWANLTYGACWKVRPFRLEPLTNLIMAD